MIVLREGDTLAKYAARQEEFYAKLAGGQYVLRVFQPWVLSHTESRSVPEVARRWWLRP